MDPMWIKEQKSTNIFNYCFFFLKSSINSFMVHKLLAYQDHMLIANASNYKILESKVSIHIIYHKDWGHETNFYILWNTVNNIFKVPFGFILIFLTFCKLFINLRRFQIISPKVTDQFFKLKLIINELMNLFISSISFCKDLSYSYSQWWFFSYNINCGFHQFHIDYLSCFGLK